MGKREQDQRLEGRCQGPVVGKPWLLSIGEGRNPGQLVVGCCDPSNTALRKPGASALVFATSLCLAPAFSGVSQRNSKQVLS